MREIKFKNSSGILCDVTVNVLDCNTIVSGFKLQSDYNIDFQINTLEKYMNSFTPSVIG